MPTALTIAAHHDDIEFLMAGTMILLKQRGWDLHYMDIADGCRGSTVTDREETAQIRLNEARQAAESLGAVFHPPICPDMEIHYRTDLLRKVAAVVRQVQPSVILTHSPIDYMEDHENACRLAVGAAFAHGMPNLESDPPVGTYDDPVTVYHAQPIGNRQPTGELVVPHFYVDISDVIDKKQQALACHESQKVWLDQSQGMDSYLQTMRDGSAEVGRMSGRFAFAEGWRRREHWGFCGRNDDPLRDALADMIAPGKPRGEVEKG
ncbi:PIG-L deacetylase family protein [Crateriforma conspicua]|uniref:4-oxalmesaconate hydratase n=1 Tax=Crateriforma conspicua TaxID=2527996 RepID=A0A5C6FYE9_9PLAN|nr:PIG-L deacetylase family protein [Crateriforma conspicua]TWU66053.1 4-oxalmesaconate hydratase [Crateriforma conspicua]